MNEKVVNAALLGLGTVGTGVYKVIKNQEQEMTAKLGCQVKITKILVRNLEKASKKVEDPSVLTTDWADIEGDPSIDIVIELIGGIEPARTYILAALKAGKNVVTANKDLIAVHGKEILETARAAQKDFLFEAAVAGGIPIISPLKNSLEANHVTEVMGIVNGTTNFILTKMSQEGMEFSDALALATELGYDGYPKLQHAMQEMIREKLTSVQRIDVAAKRIGKKDILEFILQEEIDRINSTIEETSKEDFYNAVDAISKARKIYIFAVRSSEALANFLGYYYSMIFGNVTVINTYSETEISEKLMRMCKDDVMIGISFPRYSKAAVFAVQTARKRGAKAIALTDSLISPLADSADYLLLARSGMASVVDSLVAPLGMINALIVATVLNRREEAEKTFNTLEKIWSQYKVYKKSGEDDALDKK